MLVSILMPVMMLEFGLIFWSWNQFNGLKLVFSRPYGHLSWSLVEILKLKILPVKLTLVLVAILKLQLERHTGCFSSTEKLIQARLFVSQMIYSDVSSPNLDFPNLNFLVGYYLEKIPRVSLKATRFNLY